MLAPIYLREVDILVLAPIMGNENAAMMRVVRTLKSLRALRLLRTFSASLNSSWDALFIIVLHPGKLTQLWKVTMFNM